MQSLKDHKLCWLRSTSPIHYGYGTLHRSSSALLGISNLSTVVIGRKTHPVHVSIAFPLHRLRIIRNLEFTRATVDSKVKSRHVNDTFSDVLDARRWLEKRIAWIPSRIAHLNQNTVCGILPRRLCGEHPGPSNMGCFNGTPFAVISGYRTGSAGGVDGV